MTTEKRMKKTLSILILLIMIIIVSCEKPTDYKVGNVNGTMKESPADFKEVTTPGDR